MAIAGLDLVGAFQLLVVVVFKAERAADFIHDILIRRRIVSARRLVSRAVGRFPVRVDIPGGEDRPRLVVFAEVLFAAPGPRCRGALIEVE